MNLHIFLYTLALYFTYVSAFNNTNFVCIDGNVIQLNQVCDGTDHCPDGSDETRSLCYHIACSENMFRCYYGACIKKEFRCDGLYQCVDKSDESNCGNKENCKASEFQCLSFQCIPQQKICNGVEDCLDASDENPDICDENKMSCPENMYHCKHGGCVKSHSLCNGFKDCVDGSDESKVICDYINCLGKNCDNEILCPPLISDKAAIKCMAGKSKGWVPCNLPLPVGTFAYAECKEYYKPAHKANGTRSICQPDGTWSRQPVQCEPECGISNHFVTPLIVYGWAEKAENLPWHATLYSLSNGYWNFWCGGSLVSENAVLTAAHCVWSETVDTLRIALGKKSSDYEKREKATKMFDVIQIIMHPLYQDLIGNYGSDIAILILNETVQFSTFIRPVCIDWKQNDFTQNLKKNTLGMIAGMGVTEDDTYSSMLRATHLPVISSSKCIEAQSQDFKKYITFTTFCAGWENGTGVCNGDSGGGLVFNTYKTNTWFLQGIVSVSPRRLGTSFCDPNFFTIFTKVGIYADWIRKII